MTVSSPTYEVLSQPRRRRAVPRIFRSAGGILGFAIVLLVVLVALFGPLVAPHPIGQPIGAPGQGPSIGAPLGTDFLGRDVLSRTLAGGRSTLLMGVAATLLTYALALSVGLVAGYKRSLIDPVLMRFVDLMLSFPALLLLLVLVAGFGGGPVVIIIGVALVLFPGAARIIRTATLEESVRGYVEAAVARGEHGPAVIGLEILPNIVHVVLADLGIRFSSAIVLIASLNFLGVGLKPPAADWGLMISENRVIVATNGLAVVAPAVMLGLLTVGANLMADAYARSLGRSRGKK
jgi:peptide/nickel transport system permease protein